MTHNEIIGLNELSREPLDEEWAYIEEPGFEGLYAISSYGRVAHLVHNNPRTFAGKLLKPRKHALNSANAIQYLTVKLYNNGRCVTRFVHRLVALAFVATDDTSLTVNHKEGASNFYKNLEWLTLRENLKHARDTGLSNFNGTLSPKAKMNDQQVIEMRLKYLKGGCSYLDLAKEYNIGTGTVSAILNRRTWKHL